MRFTPGPWRWAEKEYKWKPARGKERYFSPLFLQGATDRLSGYQDAHDDVVMKLTWPTKKNECIIYGLSEANKTLIASAPELYGLLKAVKDYSTSLGEKDFLQNTKLGDRIDALLKRVEEV